MARCLSPFQLTKEYTDITGKNRTINVPCGKCVSCLKRRSGHWSFRLAQEAQVSSSASFLTLTYANAPISENGFPTLVKEDFQKFLKKKVCIKEVSLLGDYLLCFHKDFSKKSVLTSLKYCKGLKYFLTDFLNSQKEIQKFINKCKENENERGFIKSTFFEYKKNCNYEFISGPFTNMIFSIISEQKSKLKILVNNIVTTISKKSGYLYRPV